MKKIETLEEFIRALEAGRIILQKSGHETTYKDDKSFSLTTALVIAEDIRQGLYYLDRRKGFYKVIWREGEDIDIAQYRGNNSWDGIGTDTTFETKEFYKILEKVL